MEVLTSSPPSPHWERVDSESFKVELSGFTLSIVMDGKKACFGVFKEGEKEERDEFFRSSVEGECWRKAEGWLLSKLPEEMRGSIGNSLGMFFSRGKCGRKQKEKAFLLERLEVEEKVYRKEVPLKPVDKIVEEVKMEFKRTAPFARRNWKFLSEVFNSLFLAVDGEMVLSRYMIMEGIFLGLAQCGKHTFTPTFLGKNFVEIFRLLEKDDKISAFCRISLIEDVELLRALEYYCENRKLPWCVGKEIRKRVVLLESGGGKVERTRPFRYSLVTVKDDMITVVEREHL